MNTARWIKGSTKEENIAIKLAGKIKNFTGRTPAIIRVKINDSMVTIHFKWVVRESEKTSIAENPDVSKKMQKLLFEVAKERLARFLPLVFGREIEFYRLDGDISQENLTVQVQLLDMVS